MVIRPAMVGNGAAPAAALAPDERLVAGQRGIEEEESSYWSSFDYWLGWVDDFLINGTVFLAGVTHGVLHGKPEEKTVDGRAVMVQTPGLIPKDWDSASARGQNAILFANGGFLYYGGTFTYSIAEGLWGEIKGMLWDLPWAVLDGSLMTALSQGLEALFKDMQTAFFLGRDMGADMIRKLAEAAEGPLKEFVAAMGRLLGSLLPDIVGAIFTGGATAVLRGGAAFAVKSAKIAPELLELFVKRAGRSPIDVDGALARATKTAEPIPKGAIDRPVINLPRDAGPLDEMAGRRGAGGTPTDEVARATAREATDGKPPPARLEPEPVAKADDLPKVRGPMDEAASAARRVKILEDAIKRAGLTFDDATRGFLNDIYRSHSKLSFDKDTISEIAALHRNANRPDLLARRGAQGEIHTLRFLEDSPSVDSIRMVRQTTQARTPDFEIVMKKGPFKGEIRQVETRTITRTSWDRAAKARVDRIDVEVRESAARFAAYSKFRRSQIKAKDPHHYKTQVYDRGYVNVQIAGDMGGRVPLSVNDIDLLRRRMTRQPNIEGVWVHYTTNGARRAQFVLNPSYDKVFHP